MQPTEKFKTYLAEIQTRLASKNKRESGYAAYETELLKHCKFFTLNGTVHHVHDSGEGNEVVILIHGWDCWWMWWHKVIGELNKQGIRTIAYDLKGHGWSDDGESHSLDSLSSDLQELVQQLGLTKYHIAAFSLGPFIALNYAQKFESQIKSLTFFNFGIFPNSDRLEKLIPTMLTFVFDRILRKVKIWWLLYAYARVTLCRNIVPKEDIIIGMNSIRFVSRKALMETAFALSKRSVTENLPKQIADLSVPVMLVAGKGDQVVSWKNTQAISKFVRNGSFELIKKCGHLITLELPKKTAELIASQVQLSQRV
jgi:pimeloyl-ACP methyl ester carboxylesterase